VLTINSVKILHAVRSAITATAELLVIFTKRNRAYAVIILFYLCPLIRFIVIFGVGASASCEQ